VVVGWGKGKEERGTGNGERGTVIRKKKQKTVAIVPVAVVACSSSCLWLLVGERGKRNGERGTGNGERLSGRRNRKPWQ